MKLKQNRSINEGARAMTVFSKNSHCDLDLGSRTLKLKIVQNIVILHICGKLNQNQNRSMNEGSRAMAMFFSKTSHCDTDLGISLLFVKSQI